MAILVDRNTRVIIQGATGKQGQYHALKMLEYNVDTPTAPLEAAVVQWHCLEDVRPSCDQFNLIHERLIDQWRTVKAPMKPGWRVHFTGVLDEPEDIGTVEYMRDVCEQAGLLAEDISEIGWKGGDFIDLAGQSFHVLFKLYPWGMAPDRGLCASPE